MSKTFKEFLKTYYIDIENLILCSLYGKQINMNDGNFYSVEGCSIDWHDGNFYLILYADGSDYTDSNDGKHIKVLLTNTYQAPYDYDNKLIVKEDE